jgi:hypothetical protein
LINFFMSLFFIGSPFSSRQNRVPEASIRVDESQTYAITIAPAGRQHPLLHRAPESSSDAAQHGVYEDAVA